MTTQTMPALLRQIRDLKTDLSHARARLQDTQDRADRAERSAREAWAFSKVLLKTGQRPRSEPPTNRA